MTHSDETTPVAHRNNTDLDVSPPGIDIIHENEHVARVKGHPQHYGKDDAFIRIKYDGVSSWYRESEDGTLNPLSFTSLALKLERSYSNRSKIIN